MEKFLRDWRQDALNKHQYDSAIFIGDKLLALTSTCFLTSADAGPQMSGLLTCHLGHRQR
jgi:hypothetical protein